MLNDFSDRTDDWERDMKFRRWLRDQGVTPYDVARRWRRRFYVALFLDVVLSILLLVLAGSR